MKVRASFLTGRALEWALTQALGVHADVPATDEEVLQHAQHQQIELLRGNPLYFPKGNERGDHYEPLWIARLPPSDLPPRCIHGPTPVVAAKRAIVVRGLGSHVGSPRQAAGGRDANSESHVGHVGGDGMLEKAPGGLVELRDQYALASEAASERGAAEVADRERRWQVSEQICRNLKRTAAASSCGPEAEAGDDACSAPPAPRP